MQYFIFTGGNYDNGIKGVEQYLPEFLSGRNKHILIFQYPRFINLVKVLLKKISYIYQNDQQLNINSIGLPLGRKFPVINKFNHKLNFLLTKKLLFKYDHTTVITFTPEFAYLKSDIKTNRTIYYVSDNYPALPVWNQNRKTFLLLEQDIIKLTDRIITVSEELFKRYQKLHPDISLFHTPWNPFTIQGAYRGKNIIFNKRKVNKPIIGFIGGLYDWKIDLQLIDSLTDYFSRTSFVFTGNWNLTRSKLTESIKMKKNFYYLGYQEPEQLAAVLSKFDICIIPYKNNEWGKYAWPVKIYEYLAMGKPVVTTDMPSLVSLKKKRLIYVAQDTPGFISVIDYLLNKSENRRLKSLRISEAIRNTWPKRIGILTNLING